MADTTLTLSRLLSRLKTVREPDRVIDRDIHRLVSGKPYGWLHPCMSAWGKGVPHYTASFEAAFALVPEGITMIELSMGWDTWESGHGWPAISVRWLTPGETDPKKWNGTVQGAPTPAVALCLAAIEMRDRMAVAALSAAQGT